MKLFCLSLYVLSLCLLCATASATHIRAGEITARRLNPQKLEYEITLRGYTDSDSQIVFGSNGTLEFGDGTSILLSELSDPNSNSYTPPVRISENVWLHTYKVKHTYPSARAYLVSAREFYRSEDILNMDASVNAPFYIETLVIADPFLGVNSTAVLKRHPIERAFTGKTFHHQPGAFDIDGDSLSYRLAAVRQDKNMLVENYRLPHHTFPQGDSRNGKSEAGGKTTFSINPLTGDITWDAPATKGNYNVAFHVEEWRKIKGKYYLIGRVMRDMLIRVEDPAESNYPVLLFPINNGQAAPEAGQSTQWTITAQAPTASDSVILEIWGDFLLRSAATASSSRVKAKGEASITIQFTGEEQMGQHYQLIARAYYPEKPSYTRNRTAVFYFNETNNPLGVGQSEDLSVQVFPNPLKEGMFYFSLPEASGKRVSVQVLDMQGRMIYQETDMQLQAKHAVALKAAKAGIHLLLVHHNGHTYRRKLVVQ